jgi:hypothetical protein
MITKMIIMTKMGRRDKKMRKTTTKTTKRMPPMTMKKKWKI